MILNIVCKFALCTLTPFNEFSVVSVKREKSQHLSQTFKNKNKRKSLLRDTFVHHFIVYICSFVAANSLQKKQAYDIAREA